MSINVFSEKIQSHAKEQKSGFLSVLLGTLGATLLGNMLTGKRVMRAGEGTIRAIKIQMYYLNENKFDDVCPRNNLTKTKNGKYVVNLDEFKSIGTLQITFYVNGNNSIHFDSFGVAYNSKEINKLTENKNIISSIYRIQAHDSMCGYFWIRFIDFMLKGKSLLDYTNLFSPNE